MQRKQSQILGEFSGQGVLHRNIDLLQEKPDSGGAGRSTGMHKSSSKVQQISSSQMGQVGRESRGPAQFSYSTDHMQTGQSTPQMQSRQTSSGPPQTHLNIPLPVPPPPTQAQFYPDPGNASGRGKRPDWTASSQGKPSAGNTAAHQGRPPQGRMPAQQTRPHETMPVQQERPSHGSMPSQGRFHPQHSDVPQENKPDNDGSEMFDRPLGQKISSSGWNRMILPRVIQAQTQQNRDGVKGKGQPRR